jgi:hypothetical protein
LAIGGFKALFFDLKSPIAGIFLTPPLALVGVGYCLLSSSELIMCSRFPILGGVFLLSSSLSLLLPWGLSEFCELFLS